MSCRVCGGDGERVASFERSITSESKVLPTPSVLLGCPSCGLLHTDLALDLADYYAHTYDAKLSDEGIDEIVSSADGKVVFRTDLDFELLMRHVGGLVGPDSRLFEFGCGRARILSRLHKAGFGHLSAFDLSEPYREGAARFCGERVYIGQRPQLECDLAYSLFVLEHDADPVSSLFYLRSVIKKGGHLYLMLPNYVTNVVDLACADHVNHFSGRYLKALLEAIGFTVLSLDEESNIGAALLLARRDGENEPAREGWTFAEPALVAYRAETTRAFLAYLDDLRATVARVGRGRRVFLYGAGFYGALWNAELEAAGHSIAGIFDANPRKTGATVLGQVVKAPETIAAEALKDAELVVCVNPKIARGVAERWAPFFAEVHAVG